MSSSIWKRLKQSNQTATKFLFQAFIRSVQLEVKPPNRHPISGLKAGDAIRSKSSQYMDFTRNTLSRSSMKLMKNSSRGSKLLGSNNSLQNNKKGDKSLQSLSGHNSATDSTSKIPGQYVPGRIVVLWTRRRRKSKTKESQLWIPDPRNIYSGECQWKESENLSMLEAQVNLIGEADMEHGHQLSPYKRLRRSFRSRSRSKNPSGDSSSPINTPLKNRGLHSLIEKKITYEPKEYTIYVCDLTNNKTLASCKINMANFADKRTVPHNLVLNLKPYYRRVESCKVNLTLGSSVLAEGSATDEDMQSLASVLSIKSYADCANLDDFSDDESSGFRMAGTNSAASLEMQNALTNLQNLNNRNGIIAAAETRSNRSGTNASTTDADSFKNLDRDFELSNNFGFNSNTMGRSKKTLILSKKDEMTSTPLRLGDLGKSKTISSLNSTSTSTPQKAKIIGRLQEAPQPKGKASNSSKNNQANSTLNKDSAIGHTQTELLTWVKNRLSDPQQTNQKYQQISITNFTTSWRNGLAFCALYDSFYQSSSLKILQTINSAYENFTENPDFEFDKLLRADAYENLKMAFNCFKNRFNIEKIIDTRDLLKAPRIDKLKIITYLNFIKDFEEKIKKEAEKKENGAENDDNNLVQLEAQNITEIQEVQDLASKNDDQVSITSKKSMRTGSVTSSLVLSPKITPKSSPKKEKSNHFILEPKPTIPPILQDKFSQDFEDALEGDLSDVEIEGAGNDFLKTPQIPKIEIISPTKSFVEVKKEENRVEPVEIGQPPLAEIKEISIDDLLFNKDEPKKIVETPVNPIDLPPPNDDLLIDSTEKHENNDDSNLHQKPNIKFTNPTDEILSKMLKDFTRELSDLSPKKEEPETNSSNLKLINGSTTSLDSIDKLIMNSKMTREKTDINNQEVNNDILVTTDSDSDESSEFSFTAATSATTKINPSITEPPLIKEIEEPKNKIPKDITVQRNPSVKNSRSSSTLSLNNRNFDEKMVSPESDLEQLEKRTTLAHAGINRRQTTNGLLYNSNTNSNAGLKPSQKAPSIQDIEKELINPHNIQLIDTTKNLRNNALKSRSEAQFTPNNKNNINAFGDIQEKIIKPSQTTTLNLSHPHKMIDRRKSDISPSRIAKKEGYGENDKNNNQNGSTSTTEILESQVISQEASGANFGDVTQELTKMTEQICGEIDDALNKDDDDDGADDDDKQKEEEHSESVEEELPRTESNDTSKSNESPKIEPTKPISNIITSPRRKNPLPSQRAAKLEEKLSQSISDELENVDSAKETSPILTPAPILKENQMSEIINEDNDDNNNKNNDDAKSQNDTENENESESDSNLSLSSEASTSPSLVEEYRKKEEEFVDIDEMAKEAEDRFRKNFSSAEEEELATKDWIAIVHKRKQLESDMEELNIRKQEQKLEVACRNLDKIILRVSFLVLADVFFYKSWTLSSSSQNAMLTLLEESSCSCSFPSFNCSLAKCATIPHPALSPQTLIIVLNRSKNQSTVKIKAILSVGKLTAFRTIINVINPAEGTAAAPIDAAVAVTATVMICPKDSGTPSS